MTCLPHSPDGVAALEAATASLAGGGMAEISVDTGSALALAVAMGASAEAAPLLIAQAARGIREGIMDRREQQ